MIFGKSLKAIHEEAVEIRFAAASLAYSTLLSIIPFLIIVLAVFQSGVGLEELYPKVEFVLLNYLKEATGASVSQYIKMALGSVKTSTLGITGVVLLLFTSLTLISSVDTAFQRVWRLKPTRPIYRRILIYWLILVAVPIALAAFVGLRSITYFKDLGHSIEHQFFFSLWTAVFVWLMYTVIPDTKVKLLASIPSAVATSLVLSSVQNSFLWVSMKVFNRNKIYGSLASFPIFLFWLMVVWYVILAGVSLCAFLQQKILKRT
ncbi:MAG: YihY family inner membrane protein [Bdellovibrio sp.]|nr:YihY family inner membrane protein [Bdellovibrio sp.]